MAGINGNFNGDYEVGDILTEEALVEFVARWKLEDSSQQLLGSLPLDVQRKIIMEFSPRDPERDANAIFVKFARGVSQGFQGTEEMQEFIKRWSLGPEASQLISRLNPMKRSKVMREFNPRDATTDVNNIFIRFAHGVSDGKGKSAGKGKGKVSQQQWGPIPAYNAGQPQAFVPYHQRPPASDPMVAQFIATWQLAPGAQDYLQSLPPMAQQKIIQEFSPRDTSRDANGIFMKFAMGVAQNSGLSGAMSGGISGGIGGGGVAGGFFQQAPVQQQPMHTPVHPNEAQGFLDQWRLGVEAQNTFYGLLPNQQQRVMTEFCPRDASSDCNNIFLKFCNGVARGTQLKGGAPGGKGGFQAAGQMGRFAPY
jgi:hypothetical protein